MLRSIMLAIALAALTAEEHPMPIRPRFFAGDSFWNTPIAVDAVVDPDSGRMTTLLRDHIGGPDGRRGFHLNLDYWTIPVYEVDAATPRRQVAQRRVRPGETYNDRPYRQSAGFGDAVPIPDGAVPSREADAHLAMIDRAAGIAWDMWGARRREDGTWESFTGMSYRLDGSGVFDPGAFPVRDGETIHAYGPSRAAGVPAIAGLIMRDEVVAGEINHRIAAACSLAAYRRFVAPAAWTDGQIEGGIPEGAVLQLDPTLDLNQLRLRPGARVVARALQRYGLVIVDVAGGAPLYGEGLWGRGGWTGVLGSRDLDSIPFTSYRVLRLDGVVARGDRDQPTPLSAQLPGIP